MEKDDVSNQAEAEQVTEELPTYIIENARSGRSKCKTCSRAIALKTLRIGILIKGPYGTGYLWHHLKCAARHQFEQVEEAYAEKAWQAAKRPPDKVPPLDELQQLQAEAIQRRQERQELPYVERAPSGRSKCQYCEELIDNGSLRVVLGREATFGRQTRTRPVNIHPSCVAAELMTEDCGTDTSGFADAVRRNSKIDIREVDDALSQVGDLPD